MRNSLRRACRAAALALTMLVVLAAQDLRAATFPNLYTVVVMPDPAAPNRRAASVRAAMMQLLERVTGRTDAGLDPELSHIVEGAENYLNSYGSIDRQRDQVGFISSRVERALTDAGWPVWGSERPMTLLWIAVDNGNGERALLSESFNPSQWSPAMVELVRSLEQALRAAASDRGLPITLPLLDLEDLQQIDFADVWGGFDERVDVASMRYGPDAYLLAQVRFGPFGTDIRWTLVQDGRRRVALSTTVEEGIDWLAEQYAAEFSVLGGNRTLRLTIDDVESLSDYGRVMSYLESVSLLSRVDVESFEGGRLELRVAARGDEAVVQRVLGLGGVLRQVAVQPSPGIGRGPRPSGAGIDAVSPPFGAPGSDATSLHFQVLRAAPRR